MAATPFHVLPADAQVAHTVAVTGEVRASEGEEGGPAVSPWIIGGITLLLLLLLLGAVIAFGGGRDHS